MAILGAGGSGKSTVCRLIAGFIPSFFKGTITGSCRIKDREIEKWTPMERRRLSGYLFQNPVNQLSHVKFTVRDEIAFGLENLGVPPKEMGDRVDGMMETLGILHLAHRNPHTLSGGELQKVCLGAVVVMAPEILLLDEPMTQLDPEAAKQIEELIIGLNRSGFTIVVTQSAFNTFTASLDRVVLLEDGRPVAIGAPAQILHSKQLERFGVTPPPFHICARMAKAQSMWPNETPLPTTMAEALAGFQKVLEKRTP